MLEHMLRHAGHAVDLLYYEVLDIPLPELEQLKTLTVSTGGVGGLCYVVKFINDGVAALGVAALAMLAVCPYCVLL
jgi:hypothetical protein